MKKTILLLLLVSGTMIATAQTRADYNAAANKLKGYYNQLQLDSMYYMMSDRLQSLAPKEQMEPGFKQLYSQIGTMVSSTYSKEEKGIYFYKTVFSNMTLSMVMALDSNNKLTTFRFIPYTPDTANREKSNYILKTATGNIYGTLTMPVTNRKIPVVLIIAGSGPTDRNGNDNMGLNTDAYKMIADSLQKAGIACVRYDKRGAGESASADMDESKFTFNDLVNDAAGFVKMLKEDSRFSSVIVLGHSEGSLAGILAAEKEKVSGFISVSGIAERMDKILEKQLKNNPPDVTEAVKKILDSLVNGYTVTNIDSNMAMLFHASVQPYLISWLKYVPAKEVKKLNIPVLIVQGTTDLQVSVDEAEKLKKAYPHATLKIIGGMNHVLKQAPADREQNSATYGESDLPLSPGLMPAIIDFINMDMKEHK